MQAQPPPDDPTLTTGSFEFNSPLWWRKSGIWLVGVLVVIVSFFWLTRPTVIRSKKEVNQTEAVNNARQIGLALFEFESEYGKFPDLSTTSPVRRETGTLRPLGATTSNDYFRQLIAAKIVQSESVFYAKINGCKKPDNRIEAGKALAKGECGFSYLVGLSSDGNPSRPLVVTPLIPGTDRFDPTMFHGKAVLLRMDNSVTSVPINSDGHVMSNGMNLLDPANPIWGGKPPVIAWPE
jgi:hypothetical protein